MPRRPPTRRLVAALTGLATAAGLAVAAPAHAAPAPVAAPTPVAAPAPLTAPAPLAAPGDSGDDGEGGSKRLVDALEDASRGYVEAEEALERARKRQRELADRLRAIDAEIGPKQAAFDEIVRRTYVTGRLGPVGALLGAESPDGFVGAADTLEAVGVNERAALADLRASRSAQQRLKIATDATVREQQKQVNVMARRKAQAENALKEFRAGQDAPSADDRGSATAPRARPAPRRPDGSLPPQGCTVNDPTTSGCITPRLAHAMAEAKRAGFTRYVACFRQQNSGEHPKGRACDFAAQKGGFGGDATGGDKAYGTNLANFYVNNSRRLGVLYVIWYRRIWLPSTGWKSYSGAGGDPSSDHTNHVHLSVR